MMIKSIALLSLVGSSALAFQTSSASIHQRSQTALAVSYLDQISASQSTPVAVTPTAAPSAPTVNAEGGGSSATLSHAPIEYFGLDKLESKGPRATADWGTPQDATRKLGNDGMLSAGSWYCSEGGWPSPNPKAHTEIFYMLEGHGMLGDADGAKHYFGPGDTVIIPKGHTGRWDVYSPIHKIWAVNAHERIEETSTPIRVQVDHYCHLFGPQYLTNANDASAGAGYDPLYRSQAPQILYNTFYDVGPTKVGVWTAGVGSISVQNGQKSFIHLLEGILYVSNSATGEAKRCVAGDTLMLPEGWYGHIDIIEPAKKLWTTIE